MLPGQFDVGTRRGCDVPVAVPDDAQPPRRKAVDGEDPGSRIGRVGGEAWDQPVAEAGGDEALNGAVVVGPEHGVRRWPGCGAVPVLGGTGSSAGPRLVSGSGVG